LLLIIYTLKCVPDKAGCTKSRAKTGVARSQEIRFFRLSDTLELCDWLARRASGFI